MASYFTTMSVTTPHRPSHQLRRSITEQSPPFRQSRVHQYLHRKDREHDDRMPLSAGPRMRGSLELPRAEPVTASGIVDPGLMSRIGDDNPNTNEAGTNLRRLPNNEEISREKKEQAAEATVSLRKSLVELNTFSNATIARLDETYSSVLQRLGSLRSTVVAMKELAAMSQQVNESFASESRALVSEIESQLSIYDQTTDQKKRILDLQARIHAGRNKVHALSKRVDAVRGRIEDWEKADREWQERTRRRLKATWIVISVVAFILTFVFVGAQYAPSSADANKPAKLVPGIEDGRPPMESLTGNSSKNAAAMANEIREALTQRRGDNVVEQEALRVFDEL